MGTVKWLAIPMMIVFSGYAESPPPAPKPVCNAQNRGRLWPEKAGRHTAGAPIELCSMHFLKYRWQKLTVDVSELRMKPTLKAHPDSVKKIGE